MRWPIDQVMIDRYAEVLIRFALNSGQGIKPGEVVYCLVPDIAKPMYGALQAAILKAGGLPLMRLEATGFTRQYFQLANDKQLTFFPQKYLKARVQLVDQVVGIIAEVDPNELKGIPPQKIVRAMEAKNKLREWQNDKEYQGKMTWTTALWGTNKMAKAASLSLTEYWDQIIRACFLDQPQPIRKWQEVFTEQNRIIRTLNSMPIEKLRLTAQGTDLWLLLGARRQWVGGSGRNIPSFEIFTSPDWRGTQGQISFNQPLYRYGQRIEGVQLIFSKGRVVKATAKTGVKLLRAIIGRPNADKLGEFSLTDARLSRITKFMATTLFDENMGGPFGNTHVAVGMSYKDAYNGDMAKLSQALAKRLGFNHSGEHTDIVDTRDRIVRAYLRDGVERIIYQDGRFTL